MKTQTYNNFWQHIHYSAKKKGLPLRVMFELTYRCNFRCKHCYVPQSYKKRKELKTKEVFSILDQLRDIGCFYLGFTGGEPFLRKDIFEILWYAKRSGFEIIIYTNGSLIDKAKAGKLRHLRPNKIDITIPAMSKPAFERISGISGSYNRVFAAIDFLYQKRVNMGFKTCVLKENASEIKEIQDFASSRGGQHRLDPMLLPRLDGSKEPYKYRGILTEADRNEKPARLRRKGGPEFCHSEQVKDKKTSQDLFFCGAGKSQVAITPGGELKMCLMIDYPRYKMLCDRVKSQEFGLRNTWERLKRLVASIEPDENYKCGKCDLAPFCKWCPAKGWLEKKDFLACDSESKFWAKMRSCHGPGNISK